MQNVPQAVCLFCLTLMVTRGLTLSHGVMLAGTSFIVHAPLSSGGLLSSGWLALKYAGCGEAEVCMCVCVFGGQVVHPLSSFPYPPGLCRQTSLEKHLVTLHHSTEFASGRRMKSSTSCSSFLETDSSPESELSASWRWCFPVCSPLTPLMG